MTVAAIVGGGGLLGSALRRRIALRPDWSLVTASSAPWSQDPSALRDWAATLADDLVAAADGGPWSLLWAAGAVVPASTESDVERELRALSAALEGTRDALSSAAERGTLFYASSAGGVYAGSADPPFTEATHPVPISPYGSFKLRAESVVAEFGHTIGVPTLAGRIANLYGPGQRLDKPQGIISHLALARFTPRPVTVYVPLDTLRDYLYVDDGADLVLDCLERLAIEGGAVTKILASGDSTTIASLLGMVRAVSKGRPKVVLGASRLGDRQARDLRLRSEVWADLDARAVTALPSGVKATLDDVEAAVLAGIPR